ncbi:MAG: hypothetical protein QOG67_1430 [Verrucomicrobiota bacterium]
MLGVLLKEVPPQTKTFLAPSVIPTIVEESLILRIPGVRDVSTEFILSSAEGLDMTRSRWATRPC